ncbi:MAG TPA: phosphoglycerate dehydrogenase [Halieaceae bacterium]|jgi:D-3-phosphoglycerate dehydrogenase|uniref:phosphoglycerate dehydrogenase n=1 Tax=Haliea TaxID=475794 RepID=UPI000C4FFC4B|nr:phosphoglycerate dehydrogenase [Haliea sp.]HBM83826.1 phosphoglycerate dehydrogenase [Halieaceae bacterium]MAY92496.1 phosphoglycerate dehydrogenase [Haliea sp.]MBK40876.1 phosphoglycerate dehydrogenase [Haliea sp.]MBP68549.1 phosphoglycerate dehydrogenase [Haliea sp.]HBQ41327.1 phosphoglycerate dehydrogenase [Halieaceae bacterium]|tara:strand:- start:5997 stop:7226 length:1230 start_codon:yes stop_codon:yes gene_type:complete
MAPKSLEKSKIRFLLLEGVHPSAVDTLRNAGYDNIELHQKALAPDDLKQAIAKAHFVGIRSRTQLTEDVLEEARKLVAIGCFCIGTNQVDLAAATRRGIAVFNAPFSNTRSVAELVIAEAILLLRGVAARNAAAHRGEWQKSATNAYEIRGKRLGIVGYGNIGMQLGVIAEGLGMQVQFCDVVSKLPLGNARQLPSLDQLLAQSDVVSLHVPETRSTRNMIGATQLNQMPRGSILLNASRGTVVDIDALAASLESGHLGGTAIDVFPVEPRSNDEEFVSPLRAFDNAILTPHIGGSTVEAQANIGVEVAEKLARYSDTGATTSSVNFPEVSLPEHEGSHRLLHIHHNVPGVMSAINRVFSEYDINVSAQFLQTNEAVGYVVIDVDAEYSDVALAKLASIDGTIRSRVLF